MDVAAARSMHVQKNCLIARCWQSSNSTSKILSQMPARFRSTRGPTRPLGERSRHVDQSDPNDDKCDSLRAPRVTVFRGKLAMDRADQFGNPAWCKLSRMRDHPAPPRSAGANCCSTRATDKVGFNRCTAAIVRRASSLWPSSCWAAARKTSEVTSCGATATDFSSHERAAAGSPMWSSASPAKVNQRGRWESSGLSSSCAPCLTPGCFQAATAPIMSSGLSL